MISDEIYEGWMKKTQKEKIQHILEHCPPQGKILDVACGPGFLEELVDNVTAIDINPGYVKKVAGAILMDANELTFPPQSFSTIYAIDIIHLLEPKKFLPKVKQILRKDGKLVLTTFCNENNVQEKTNWLKSLVKDFSIEKEFVVRTEKEWDFVLSLVP